MRTYGRVPVVVRNDPTYIVTTTGDFEITTSEQFLVEAPFDASLPEERVVMQWVQVDPTAAGFDDYIYITTLIQTLKLNLGESPFYANYGIPAKASIVQQVAPDFYVMRTQQQFAGFFANLTIARAPAPPGYAVDTPTYNIAVTTHEGVKLSVTVPIAL